MLADAEKSYPETFIVWNDDINLISALIPSEEGKATVSGTIKFKDGQKLSFSSKQDDREILHERLVSVCQQIAKFYRTNVIRKKDSGAGSSSESSVLLKIILPLLN